VDLKMLSPDQWAIAQNGQSDPRSNIDDIEHSEFLDKCAKDVADKVRYRRLKKNTGQIVTLFALSNLCMACHRLMPMTGEVRP
jgi:hypothetical protein